MPILETLKDLTIIIGGWWTFYLYKKQATAALNPQLQLTTDLHPYDAESRLAFVRLQISNVGKVPLTLTSQDRLSVVVRRVVPDLPHGFLNTDKLPVIFESDDLLKRSLAQPPHQYRLEPSVQIDDAAPFVLAGGQTYHIEAKLRFTEGVRSDWISTEAMVTVPSNPDGVGAVGTESAAR
ncbi:hypothetical protein [Cupriavidus basilensis]|uniref:hypothetical protein n=1 Tax=Cupriavidus basilensis TaxID=68895 RepID=UPI0012DFF0D1|nr:hypothetical protein [Cupriavidus basilensis]